MDGVDRKSLTVRIQDTYRPKKKKKEERSTAPFYLRMMQASNSGPILISSLLIRETDHGHKTGPDVSMFRSA